MYYSCSPVTRNHWLDQKQFAKRFHFCTHENRCQNQPKFTSKSHNRESHWLTIHVNYSSGMSRCHLLNIIWWIFEYLRREFNFYISFSCAENTIRLATFHSAVWIQTIDAGAFGLLVKFQLAISKLKILKRFKCIWLNKGLGEKVTRKSTNIDLLF